MPGRYRALVSGWCAFQHKLTSFNWLPVGDLKPQKEPVYSDLNYGTFQSLAYYCNVKYLVIVKGIFPIQIRIVHSDLLLTFFFSHSFALT